MAVDTTLTSYTYDPWVATDVNPAGSDLIDFSYADLGFTPSASDSYKSTSGDVFKIYIDGVRIYRSSDSAYASGEGFLEDGDSSGAPGTLVGVSAGWADTSDTVWTIDTANQKIIVDKSEVTDSLLYGTGTTTSGDADGLEVSFTGGTTIIELRRSVQDQSGPSVDFSNASILTEQDLDNAGKNVFHMAQQAVVTANKGIIFDTGAGVWDAQQDAVDKKIRGVAAPVLDNEAVNKGFLSTNLANITTVAGISGNVTTVADISGNVTTVATDASDIGRVAAVDTEIGRIGTSAMAASIALIGTTGYAHASTGDIKLVADIAANVTKVADIDSDVTAVAGLGTNGVDVTTVSNIGTDGADVTTVAGKATEIGRIGTAPMAASIALIGTAPMANSTDGDIKVVADNNANVTKVADIDANVTKVADIDGNVTTVATLGTNGATVTTVAGKATEIGRIGTSAMAASIALIGTDAYAHASTGDIKLVADIASNVTKVADIDDKVTIVAGLGSSGADVTTVAGKATEIGRLGTEAAVADMALLGLESVITDMDLLGASGVIDDMEDCADNLVIIGAATTKANEASASATAASASEVAARASAAAVSQTFDNFADVYLGSMADGATADTGTLTGASWAKDSSSIAFTGTTGTISVGQELTSTGSGYPVGANIIGSSVSTPLVISNPFTVAGTGATLNFVGSGVYGAYDVSKDGPGLDNDGDALAVGMLYFNSTDNEMRIYGGSTWIAATSAGTTSLLIYKYVATADQTTFTGSDANSATLAYTVNNINVYLNGVRLDASDYTADNGTSIVLGSGAALSDELVVIAFKSFTVADMVPASTGGTFTGAVTASGGVVGNLTGNASGTAATVTGATQAAITSTANLVTVGALDTGSITSGFTSIDVGAGAIATTGALTGGTATVTGLITANGGIETDTNSKVIQKGAFMQSSTHQSLTLGY